MITTEYTNFVGALICWLTKLPQIYLYFCHVTPKNSGSCHSLLKQPGMGYTLVPGFVPSSRDGRVECVTKTAWSRKSQSGALELLILWKAPKTRDRKPISTIKFRAEKDDRSWQKALKTRIRGKLRSSPNKQYLAFPRNYYFQNLWQFKILFLIKMDHSKHMACNMISL